MKILVLATNYTVPNSVVASHFIHSRNLLYIKEGIDVSVLSFATKNDYEIDGVKVFTQSTIVDKLENERYDIVLSHAPNLRNHYRFLKKHSENFNQALPKYII